MPNEDEYHKLCFRLGVVERAVFALLERGGASRDLLTKWHREILRADLYGLNAAMNELLLSLPSQSLPTPSPRPPSSATLRSMCGRARLTLDWHQIRISMKLADDAPALNLRPSWNIAPTQDMLIVADRPGVGRIARLAKWGLIPSWSKEPKAMGATFNAREDTMRDKPNFRNAWAKGRRCLIVCDGFYEWQRDDKWPVAIARQDKKPMTFGGLWERWAPPGAEEVYSCTIITQDAGPAMRLIHDREPLIIDEKDWPVWLGEVPGDVDSLIKPVPLDTLVYWKVPKEVGNVKNNSPALVEQVGR